MSEPEHLVEARRWLRYAAEDFIAAQRLLTDVVQDTVRLDLERHGLT